ncbi:MAG: O-antigen biosynthesis protein, partial [Solirubrobacteraceae bacterium]|nr:O-antigen biosynthesis protein [Solirubrobacteraceae bacterium]
ALLSIPRVHRFAAPPVLGDAATAAVPLAVCIDPAPGGDADATHASLSEQVVAAADVVEARPDEALASTRAPWLLVVPAGDRLSPLAVKRFGQAITLAPDAALLTCDEDELDHAGTRRNPTLRPGPSPDLMLAVDLVGSSLCVRSEAARAAGATVERYRLALALAGGDGAGHAHIPAILLHRAHRRDDPAPTGDAEAAVRDVLATRGEAAARVESPGPGHRRVRRALRGEPSVEVIVCFRDRPGLLRRCAESLLALTAYERLQLTLIDNASTNPDVAALLAELDRDARVATVRDEHPFNFSALNNAAAARSKADVLVFLNNDTEVLEGGWVEELLEEAQRDCVGAVAPLLVYPDANRVQHVGAAIGLHGYAGHPFAGLRPDEQTPFGSALDGTRNWLAVTAACLMVERRKFAAVGGFDEGFTVAGNDVDLGLRLTAAGFRSLCVPHVRLAHAESRTRGSEIPDRDFTLSRERYGAFRTVGDPFYNPNLTLADTDCGVRRPEELP